MDVHGLGAMSSHRLFARQSASSGSTSQGSSLSSLLSTLIPVFIVASIIFIVFLILQRFLDRVYGPRTFLVTLDQDERSPKQTAGFLGFRKELSTLADEFVLGRSSIDNYLWLRFFKMISAMCFAGCLFTWPILFPINFTGGGGETGTDRFSFSNVTPGPRYFAQAASAVLFLSFVMYTITRETLFYVQLRQAYFLSPYMTSRISTKTVLFVDVPELYRSEAQIRHVFPNVRTVWPLHDVTGLEDHVDDRDTAFDKLETGTVKMLKNYVRKQIKAGNKGSENGLSRNGDARGDSIAVDKKDRPMHKTKFLVGKKVDTIDWSRNELRRLIPQVLQEQSEYQAGHTKLHGAVFVEFQSVRDAQAAFMLPAHHTPFKMISKDAGMTPDSVIWKNVKKPGWLVKALGAAGTIFIAVLCLFWTLISSFVGILSNINLITDKVPFLSFIQDIPQSILGLITGLLPAILTAVLIALVPIVCNIIAAQFEPTQGAVQLRVQAWFFPFQVIQIFLVTTIASGAASVATEIIDDPQSAVKLLAKNLPRASNFFISFIILQGMMIAALQVLNIVPLLFFLVLGKILDTTPRKMFNRYTTLGGIGWGSLYAKIANLVVIVLAYSSIAPLILGFAAIGFFLMYLAFRYNCFFTLGTTVSTHGLSYARALQQITVGIYLSELCLIGLFAISSGQSKFTLGPLVIMVIFLVATILWHLQMRKALRKLTVSLPSTLMAGEYPNLHGDAEKGHLNGKDATGPPDNYQVLSAQHEGAPAASRSLVGRIKTFFMPTKYDSAATLSKHILSPHLAAPIRPYTERERAEAYLHPALSMRRQVVWVPRDQYGLSRQEVHASRETIGHNAFAMTDDAAWFDDKGKIQWDQRDVTKTPVWVDEPKY